MAPTRSVPDFTYDSQKELYTSRRNFAAMTKFPFFDEFEEAAIKAMTEDQTNAALALITERMEEYKKASKKKGKRAKKPAEEGAQGPSDEQENPSEHGDEETPERINEGRPSDEPDASNAGNVGDNESQPDDSDPSSSSSSSDDDSDPRKRRSRKDKESIRGRTPRIKTGDKLNKKLFKMDPPEKYSGDKDSDRTYAAVHKFLSQLLRYLRLATSVDMKEDISEYVLGFLDGFAFEWFDTLDKGDNPFRWEEFESAICSKFIPREHIQMAIDKYMAIRQGERPVSEYIVERERLENTLGKLLAVELKETSFRKGLNKYMKDNMIAFRGLPYAEYVRSAEDVDQDAKERKVGHYASKQNPSSSKGKGSTSSEKSKEKSGDKTSPGKSSKNPKLSRAEMRKQGICFTCNGKGHIAKDCPTKQKDKDGPTLESNSIRVSPMTGASQTTSSTQVDLMILWEHTLSRRIKFLRNRTKFLYPFSRLYKGLNPSAMPQRF
jgi:hypothetical protein